MAPLPRLFSVLKCIAVATALVGFAQSMLVASLYKMRSNLVYNIVSEHSAWVPKFFQYMGFNLLLAFGSSLSLFLISPAASGSGIPDVKAYLNGASSPIFRNFFTIKTFVAKVIGSALAVASSLVMGKEGPMLHAGSILAVILGSSRWFKSKTAAASHWGIYTHNRDIRDLVACGAACGVCTAFKAPVGGVLFAMEMSTRWRKELTWRCFLVSAITIVVVRYLVSTCVAHGHCAYLQWGSLAWFQQAYPSPYSQARGRGERAPDVWAFVLLAVLGGYIGSLFTAFNTWVCLLRKRWSRWFSFRVLEVCVLSVLTSALFFALPLAGRCRACTSTDPEHCVSGGAAFRTFRGYRCGAGTYNDAAGFVIQALFVAPSGEFSVRTLVAYSAVYYLLAALTYGAFIPSGLFTVGIIFGGCFGRVVAELLAGAGLIDAGAPGIVGMYALMGAASFLGGVMRMSASMCLILMEMTGAPGTLPFLMMVLVIAKGVGDRFNYSIFDHQIMLKGLQVIGGIPEHVVRRAHLDAADVMARPGSGGPGCGGPAGAGPALRIVEGGAAIADALDADRTVNAFPVLAPAAAAGEAGDFMGVISRVSLRELLAKHGESATAIDLSCKVEVAPIAVPPSMPLHTLLALMNEQGLDYVPVIRRHGPLEGMVTRAGVVAVQASRLDRFHVRDALARADEDIRAGRLIASMALPQQTAALRDAVVAPLARAAGLLRRDGGGAGSGDSDDGEEGERAPMIYLGPGQAWSHQQHPDAGGGAGGGGGPPRSPPLSPRSAALAAGAGERGEAPAQPSRAPGDHPQQLRACDSV
ncbi:chloride channel CLC-c [Raphidocelis subcapitata]|uniref:Chloride channel protein n=1 Tax=Raphidocelis subcapitata TaxID=307507 RepID=A0A2V0PC83_9CHLO|nr:chloride channel CLC-c [Raphidocelis subcapitata]|eukprot:GBF95490.1 chloride channel CLC-c [Raphidocelis subcapitata]